jgi:3-hydroxyisobutyrate dehydrogenase
MSSAAAGVGFVGLGAIGAVQAGKLLESGHELAVFDTRRAAVERLAAAGAEPCASVAEVAERAATVMASLPTPEVVAEVLAGEGGLLGGGAIETFVDLSTTGPRTARELARIAAERGVSYLDAPVSGGVAGARAGTLAVYAAGASEVLERCRPLLEPFAATIVAVGTEPGQGQVAKLLNNLLSATAMAITAEAMAVGTRAGLDPESLLAAFNAGSGRNSATATKFPEQVLSRRFDSGFRLDLMLKDVRLAVAAAAEEGVPMRVGSEVGEVWELAAEAAPEGADHTEIVRLFEDLG